MQLCDPHFQAVETSIRIRDLWNHQLHDQCDRAALIRWINGEQQPSDPTDLFDSVIAMQAIIFQKALDVVGISLMASEKCALCEVVAVCGAVEAPSQIINHAADQVLKAAIVHGLVKVTMQ